MFTGAVEEKRAVYLVKIAITMTRKKPLLFGEPSVNHGAAGCASNKIHGQS